jgi:predicted RND superfamily exporter protein
MSTSAVLACGFAILCFGSFAPTAHFGFLTCVAIISALIGDIFLLPWLLVFNEKYLRFQCGPVSLEALEKTESVADVAGS